MAFTIAEIINYLGEEMVRSHAHLDVPSSATLDTVISSIATLEQAAPSDISFLANSHYESKLYTTNAGAVLVPEAMRDQCPAHSYPIVVTSPYLAYAKLTALFANASLPASTSTQSATVHPTAIVGNHVKLGQNTVIGAYCEVGDNCVIGDEVVLHSHVTLQSGVCIGNHSELLPHVFIGHHCVIGEWVSLHSHASIGNEGFGFAPKGQPDTAGWQKIHQLGRVVIGNHVRVGSHTCIDRGALNDTLIGDNVIIDNLVQIAHNVQIGAGTAIAACVGVAGSTTIGKRCMIGGGAGFTGHIHVCDDVTITGMTMVTKNIRQAGVYSSGLPAMPSSVWKCAFINFKNVGKKL